MDHAPLSALEINLLLTNNEAARLHLNIYAHLISLLKYHYSWVRAGEALPAALY